MNRLLRRQSIKINFSLQNNILRAPLLPRGPPTRTLTILSPLRPALKNILLRRSSPRLLHQHLLVSRDHTILHRPCGNTDRPPSQWRGLHRCKRSCAIAVLPQGSEFPGKQNTEILRRSCQDMLQVGPCRRELFGRTARDFNGTIANGLPVLTVCMGRSSAMSLIARPEARATSSRKCFCLNSGVALCHCSKGSRRAWRSARECVRR